MIDVEALIRQIIPQVVMARGSVRRIEKVAHRGNRGIRAVAMAGHSRTFPWFNEEEEQHGRERDNERRASHRRVSCAQRI